MSTIKFSHNNFVLKLMIIALILLPMMALSSAASPLYASSGWEAKYWNNLSLSGDPVLVRQESDLNHVWSHGTPNNLIDKDKFSARWKRTVNFPSGTYRFTATMDDGMRVWVDGNLIISSWWDSQVHSMSSDVYLNGGDHNIKVEYYEAGGEAIAKLSWTAVGGGNPTIINNWRGEYFNNRYLNGTPSVVRDDGQINFNWSNGSPVAGVLGSDNFSARWTRNVQFNAGRYRFSASGDDGLRLWVNNQLIIDKWFDHNYETYSADIDLPSGAIPIRLEYYENNGAAAVALNWVQVSVSNPVTPPPSSSVAVATVSNTYNLNVRSGPGTGNSIIAVVNLGNNVELLGRNLTANWLKIRLANGTQGWASASFLATSYPLASLPVQLEGTVSQPPTNQPSVVSGTGTVATYYLNVRYGPSIGYGVMATLSQGQVVSLSQRNASGSWVKVILSNGQQGWVNASYLSTSTAVLNLPVAS
jgi:uncharacterized protein YraI